MIRISIARGSVGQDAAPDGDEKIVERDLNPKVGREARRFHGKSSGPRFLRTSTMLARPRRPRDPRNNVVGYLERRWLGSSNRVCHDGPPGGTQEYCSPHRLGCALELGSAGWRGTAVRADIRGWLGAGDDRSDPMADKYQELRKAVRARKSPALDFRIWLTRYAGCGGGTPLRLIAARSNGGRRSWPRQ